MKIFLFHFLIFYFFQNNCSNFNALAIELKQHVFQFLDIKNILYSTRIVSTQFYNDQHEVVIKKIVEQDGDRVLFKWIEHVVQELNENRYTDKGRFFEINNGAFFKVLTTYFLQKHGVFPDRYFQTIELHAQFAKKFDLKSIKNGDQKFDLLAVLPRMCEDSFDVSWFSEKDFENERFVIFNGRALCTFYDFFEKYLNKKNSKVQKLFFFLHGISHCIDVDYYEKYEKNIIDFLLYFFITNGDKCSDASKEYCLARYVNYMENEYKKSANEFRYNCFHRILNSFLKREKKLSSRCAQWIIKTIDFYVQVKDIEAFADCAFLTSLKNKAPGKYHVLVARHYLNSLILLKELSQAKSHCQVLKKFHPIYESLTLNLPPKNKNLSLNSENDLKSLEFSNNKEVKNLRDRLAYLYSYVPCFFAHTNIHNLFCLCLILLVFCMPDQSNNLKN